MHKIKKQGMKQSEASELLGLSYRQTLRIYARYEEEGEAGLTHRSRGQASNRAWDPREKKKILTRYVERYCGFGPTFAVEKLAQDGFTVDHDTLRGWLMQAGLWQKRRRRKEHRRWRARKEHFGELVQMDGSHHRWFGEAGEYYCLLNMIDDATGTTWALLDGEETIDLAMRTLWGWIQRYGLPKALYVDRKNVYITGRPPTREEELRDERPLTHFGKACQKLNIEIQVAGSPQAKGRVERSHGVHQDRLVKELHLAKIKDTEKANQFLVQTYLDPLNKKFTVRSQQPTDFHRPVPRGLDLRTVFCIEHERQVQNDWTVRADNHYYQILRENPIRPRPGEKVILSKWLDTSIHLTYKGRELNYKALPERPDKPVVPGPRIIKPRRRCKPGPDHPWRKYPNVPRANTVGR